MKNYSRQVLRNVLLEIRKIDHEVNCGGEYDERNDGKKERENTLSLGVGKFSNKKPDAKN